MRDPLFKFLLLWILNLSDAYRRSLQGQAISTDYSKKSDFKVKELDIALLTFEFWIACELNAMQVK